MPFLNATCSQSIIYHCELFRKLFLLFSSKFHISICENCTQQPKTQGDLRTEQIVVADTANSEGTNDRCQPHSRTLGKGRIGPSQKTHSIPAIAKKEGRYKGRNKIVVPGIEEYYNRYMTRQATKTQIAKELKISRCTLDRLFREYKISQ